MRRRLSRHIPEHDKHERWMVSYADFITLLFAFFVVMYAVSSVNEKKYSQLSGSLAKAFQQDKEANVSELSEPSPLRISARQLADRKIAKEVQARKRFQEKMKDVEQALNRALAPLIADGKVQILRTASGISVEINASVLFESGRADLAAESKRTLWAISDQLLSQPFKIKVEGHTDDRPISNGQFSSNWELSSFRASRVIHLFRDRGINENRMAAVAYAATQPIQGNDNEEGRARNRRVTLIIELPSEKEE